MFSVVAKLHLIVDGELVSLSAQPGQALFLTYKLGARTEAEHPTRLLVYRHVLQVLDTAKYHDFMYQQRLVISVGLGEDAKFVRRLLPLYKLPAFLATNPDAIYAFWESDLWTKPCDPNQDWLGEWQFTYDGVLGVTKYMPLIARTATLAGPWAKTFDDNVSAFVFTKLVEARPQTADEFFEIYERYKAFTFRGQHEILAAA